LRDNRAQQLPDVVLGPLNSPNEPINPRELLDRIGRLGETGVGTVGAHLDGQTCAEWCDNAIRYGEEIIAKLR
jgi:hypothetical protein